jgi:hypothetical protein
MEAGSSESWQIRVAPSGVIVCKFIGPTPLDELSAFIIALEEIMPAANARLVFDLRELGGYNSDTKAPMKAWLLEHKLAIRELTVLVPKSSTILKVVVAAIALATGMKLKIREDLDEAASLSSP